LADLKIVPCMLRRPFWKPSGGFKRRFRKTWT
jgi:hypothetical protein